jgi:hypothetical protein
MKKLIIPIALLAMAALIGAAMAWDCVRLANEAHHRVELADQELAKHEQRLVKTLSGSTERSPEVEAALKDYAAAWDLKPRHAAYDKLVVSFQQTMSGKIDPTNPLQRKFMDDVAGAINRREIAEKAFDVEWTAYQEFMNSRRGKVAGFFTSEKFSQK